MTGPLFRAAEADLALRGMDADTLTMRHFTACVRGLMADPSSLLARELGGEGLTLSENLLFAVVDTLRVANWQRTKDGTKGTNVPKSIRPKTAPRPRSTDADPQLTAEEKRARLRAIGPPNVEPLRLIS